uniref:Ig-like domain-containing protein n=1 Tax=Salmo trutta TaxID=8032 RepID=A0A674BEG7_SALTR
MTATPSWKTMMTQGAGLVLTQEKPLSVNVGDNVKLSCAQSSGSWTISWYQQKAGGGPSYLLATGISSGSRANGLPSRFTYSGSAEDLAVYYCACHTSPFSLFLTYVSCVLLSAHPPSKPSLVLMAPAQAPLSRDKTTLLCLAQGFHPDCASLSWSADSGSLTGPDGTYALSSILSLPSTHWSSGQTFTCRLSHSALTNPLSRSVSNMQCLILGQF